MFVLCVMCSVFVVCCLSECHSQLELVHSGHLVLLQVALLGIRSRNLLAGNPWVLGSGLANGTTWASDPYLLEGGNKTLLPELFWVK